VGCARPLEDAMRIAFEELIYWMEDDWGIPAPDGYLLLAQVAEARCTQMVNPKIQLHLHDLEGDPGVLSVAL
jgi:amidase